jgi:hypothetical protein
MRASYRNLTTALALCLIASPASPSPVSGMERATVRFGNADSQSPPLPWEIWRDPAELARLPAGDQVLLQSSFCPGGCRFDRTSDGDPRFLYVQNGEAVIFDEPGAGAVTRIWMTMGPGGVSGPLDPSIRLRIRLDGEAVPRIDLPLPELFRGDRAPFVQPLVADRNVASGGNVSYVPIPYRKGCRISLVGAERARIWYQVTYHRLASPAGVKTFTGEEDLAPLVDFLRSGNGGNGSSNGPWPRGGLTLSRAVRSVPGGVVALGRWTGPDLLQTLRLKAAPGLRERLRLRLTFDGERRADLPLSDFFAVGQGGQSSQDGSDGSVPTRSVLLGVGEDGFLYSHFPMPFFTAAEISLADDALPGTAPAEVEVSLRFRGSPPPADAGLFGAVRHVSPATEAGRDIPLLALAGRGKWVGLFAELGSVGTASREYLEGDERVYVDGAPDPAHYGTGTEDFFNGGFYFDGGPFRHPLFGSPYHEVTPAGEDVTAMFRLMLTDAVPFASSLAAGLEGGPSQNLRLKARTVAFYYSRSRPRLVRVDTLDLGSTASRRNHAYVPPAGARCRTLDARFEGEPGVARRAAACAATGGESRFVLRRPLRGDGPVRLRRILDAGAGAPAVDVYVDGRLAGTFPRAAANPLRRWRSLDLDLAAGAGSRELAIRIVPRPTAPGRPPAWNESAWELWAPPPPGQ